MNRSFCSGKNVALRAIASIIAVALLSSNASAQTIPEAGKSTTICIQTWMGTYLCADENAGGLVVVNRAEAKEWEQFELTRIDGDHVTLRAHNGMYLCAEKGGGSIVVANRQEAKEWETFTITIDGNGLVSLAAHNGQYVCADKSGALLANRSEAGPWERFFVLAPENAEASLTRIEVNVYEIGNKPVLWHTGTVVDGREYWFSSNNQVESSDQPKQMPGMSYHRTMVRFVPGDLDRVKGVLNEVVNRWNGTRYDLGSHNCNFFTNDLLHSLGVPGLDSEYLNASGAEKLLRQTPGGATAQEVLVKWPLEDKRLDEAFMEDLKRLRNLPSDVRQEVGNAVRNAGKAVGKVFGW